MIVNYTELPEGAGGPRPLVDITLADMDELRFPCLVDSGALHSLLPYWLADAAGIDLHSAERRSLAVASATTSAAFVAVRIGVGDHTWEAELGFCDSWPYSWGLLGHRSFFRYFTVTFRAVDFEFELTPMTA